MRGPAPALFCARGHDQTVYRRVYKGQSHGCAECHRLYMKRYNRKRLYGLTDDQIDALATAACDCCGRQDQPMHVDHNHDTGTVRGFLCSPCNTGLGHFGDNREKLTLAIGYLQRTEVKG